MTENAPLPDKLAQSLQLAIACHQIEHFREAETHYLAVLQMEPAHALANHNMGTLLVQKNDPAAALPYFIAAIEAEPACAQYWLSYISALFQSGQRMEALQMLEFARQQGLQGAEVDNLAARWSGRFSDEENAHPAQPKSHRVRQAELAAALSKKQVADFYYNIEVSGGCNLRCPSCAVGNTFVGGPAKSLMKLESFEAILHKIREEQDRLQRKVICLDLYNWGEPLLNPELPAMVRLARARGFNVGISTNLNFVKNLEELVCAEPDYIRISLSGYFQETYARTHKGGDIEVVKDNMRLLRAYMNKHHPATVVVVGYITYKHNCTDELALMAALCNELDFKFSKDTAILMPLEKLLSAIENDAVPEALEAILPISPRLMADLSKPSRDQHPDCALRRSRMVINADGSVPLCCAVWSHEYDVAANYLDTSEADIQQARYRHSLCKRCMYNMADFTYNAIYVEPVMDHLRAAIG